MLAALLQGCFPDFSGLSEGTAASNDAGRDPSLEGNAPSIDGSSPSAEADAECGRSCDSSADVAKIDPCQGDGGPGAIYVAASRGDYCIDKTEVTNGAYEQFVSQRPDWGPQDQPAFCSWNTKLTSDLPNWPRPGEEQFPVIYLDWCDAWSYCKWVGKRLCGQIGGGSVADALATDPTRSQWYLACAGNPGTKYPYGDTYQPLACNGVEVAPPQIREVGTATCEGHAPGLLDMSGNVFEWIDSCDSAMGPADACRMMGGGYASPAYELVCDYRVVNARNLTTPNLGFRCCADL